MSIESLWRAIESELAASPQVAASLRPPASLEDMNRWRSVVGPLPNSLEELYAGHDGSDVIGGSGFSFIGEWYPLPIAEAIVRYGRCRQLTELFNVSPLIPFAVNPTVSHLAVPVGGGDQLHIAFDDAPPFPCSDSCASIEELLSATVSPPPGSITTDELKQVATAIPQNAPNTDVRMASFAHIHYTTHLNTMTFHVSAEHYAASVDGFKPYAGAKGQIQRRPQGSASAWAALKDIPATDAAGKYSYIMAKTPGYSYRVVLHDAQFIFGTVSMIW